jgi:hypothetical protein
VSSVHVYYEVGSAHVLMLKSGLLSLYKPCTLYCGFGPLLIGFCFSKIEFFVCCWFILYDIEEFRFFSGLLEQLHLLIHCTTRFQI